MKRCIWLSLVLLAVLLAAPRRRSRYPRARPRLRPLPTSPTSRSPTC
jgi:hypothetical protein